MRINTTISDETAPFLRELERTFPEEYRKALKSVGWELQKATKKALRYRDPPGTSWQNRSGATKTFRRAGRARGAKYNNLNVMGGNLLNLIRYRMKGDGVNGRMRVHIGWLNKEVAKFGWAFQHGGSTTVTRQMQKKFWAVGRSQGTNLRAPKLGSQIEQPERPLIKPVFDYYRNDIPIWIEKKIDKHLQKTAQKIQPKRQFKFQPLDYIT